ncbi:MAG TPA: hypothetical protein VGY51_03030 [Acidimicrobiales bacterium]|jgi:hypothetical protein|nr:hypothetical protein [Acidimicrobiales bacterium]
MRATPDLALAVDCGTRARSPDHRVHRRGVGIAQVRIEEFLSSGGDPGMGPVGHQKQA